MALTNEEREILAACAEGSALCFSQDGEVAWLTSALTGSIPRKMLPPSYDKACRSVIEQKLVACDPDPGHWTEANHFEITEAGHAALA